MLGDLKSDSQERRIHLRTDAFDGLAQRRTCLARSRRPGLCGARAAARVHATLLGRAGGRE